jgi:hypothetical protein
MDLPILGKDVVGVGVGSEYTTWFTVPKNVELTAPLKLVYYLSHSPTLVNTSSSTVLLNDQPVQSLALTLENVPETVYEVSIPAHLVRPGGNSITFRFHPIGDVNHPGVDVSDPGNWVIVHQGSYLQMLFDVKGIEKLSDFPEPYVRMGPMTDFPLGLVFPSNPNSEELSAAATLIQYLGILEHFHYPAIQTFTGQVPLADLKKYNLISVGAFDRNLFWGFLAARIPADVLEGMNKQSGLVAVGESPGRNGRTITWISGADSSALLTSARTLTDPSLVSRMAGFYEVVDTSKPFPEEPFKEITNPTFKELGYFPVKLAGILKTDTSYYYAKPSYWDLLPGAAVVLKTTHSALLDPDASIVTVTVNDKPLETFKLSGSSAISTHRIVIPDGLLQDPTFYVVVSATLTLKEPLAKPELRSDPAHDKAWVFIHDSSFFKTPHEEATLGVFETFPGVFMGKKGVVRPVKIIIPDNASSDEYDAAFNIVYAIASLMPADTRPKFEILKVSEATPEILKSFDLILIGSLEGNPLVSQVNEYLPLPVNPETGAPATTRIEILPQFLEDTASLELSKSPWNGKKNILVVSSPYDYLIKLASQMMLNRNIASQWKGNVVLINGKYQWYSYAYGVGAKKGKILTREFYLKLGAVCVIILTIMISFIFYRRRKYSFRDPFAE